MKKTALIPFLLMVIIITISSCNNKSENPVVKKNYAWVVGEQDSTGYGVILFSNDGGENWERQAENLEIFKGIDLSDVWAIDDKNVWVTGSNNSIYKTQDGGTSWSMLSIPSGLEGANILDICIANKINIWVSGQYGDNGFVYTSDNYGGGWLVCDTTFFKNTMIQGVLALDNQEAYVVGAQHNRSDRGFIAFTNDGGLYWDTIMPTNDYNKWEWIGIKNFGNSIVVYGEEAHYMVSTDGGTTWKNDSVPNTGGSNGADINDLIMVDSKTWWGAFDMGEIYITTDGGTSWLSQETPEIGATFLMGIDAYNKEIALAVPSASVWPPICPIIKTDDGGATWQRKYVVHSSLNKISFIKD